MKKYMLAACLSISVLAGCATNLDGVRRFAKDTDTLVAGVNTQIAYLPTSCQHRLNLVELVRGRDTDLYRDTKQACDDMTVAAKAAGGMTKAVTEYAKAFAALAQDSLATYSTELDGLSSSVKALKKSDQTPALSPDKVAALEKLANLLLETATKGMRQRELKHMLAQHDALAAILDQLAGTLENEYVLALKLEDDEYAGKLVLLRRVFAEKEPLRVRELEREFETSRQSIADKVQTANKTAQGLRDLIKAHAALKEKANSLDTANELKELNDFRKRVVEVHDALAKAF